MPEVVYATPDAEGKSRNWDDVFPIWKLNAENTEWVVINTILEAVAMNNRFGERTPDEMRKYMLDTALKSVIEYLAETETALAALPNPSLEEIRKKGRKEVITEEHTKVLKDRTDVFSQYGKHVFYINAVFDNLGVAYR